MYYLRQAVEYLTGPTVPLTDEQTIERFNKIAAESTKKGRAAIRVGDLQPLETVFSENPDKTYCALVAEIVIPYGEFYSGFYVVPTAVFAKGEFDADHRRIDEFLALRTDDKPRKLASLIFSDVKIENYYKYSDGDAAFDYKPDKYPNVQVYWAKDVRRYEKVAQLARELAVFQ